jgi:hypothetical protein
MLAAGSRQPPLRMIRVLVSSNICLLVRIGCPSPSAKENESRECVPQVEIRRAAVAAAVVDELNEANVLFQQGKCKVVQHEVSTVKRYRLT